MIEVKNLCKDYGPRTAITDLNFSIADGEIVGFLGPNGAGKSTTMKILTGFMPATAGTATVAGYDVFEHPIEVKKNVGYLPETPPVYLDMQVEDYLRFAAKLHGVPHNQLKRCVDSALERTGLTQVRGRLIGNLSKGFRQRVGIAQAIAHNPEVLILDEPTVGLDPRQIIEIRDLIKSIGEHHTVILSTHILQEVTQTCDRAIIISQGRIAAQDTIEHLTSQTRYALTVKEPRTDGITALQRIRGVRAINVSGQKLMMEIDPEAGEIRDQIIETAVQSKLGVLEFATGKVSLEEVFLQLTSQ